MWGLEWSELEKVLPICSLSFCALIHIFFQLMQTVEGGPSLKDKRRWSPEFVDFVERCLVVNPDKRATAAQLLDHPFLSKM